MLIEIYLMSQPSQLRKRNATDFKKVKTVMKRVYHSYMKGKKKYYCILCIDVCKALKDLLKRYFLRSGLIIIIDASSLNIAVTTAKGSL